MTAQARLLGGRYQVGELLGYGGMAEVHKGRDLRLGRDVAIKMLRTDLARDATFQERFRREAQNSAALNHPAIVAVYDTGEEISVTGEKLPFIVMEFVNGQTLKEVLAQEQRLQPRRALEIMADICAALEFSHRHGIIHRDIKPGNVMITQNGQVKVMDFGIARALASGATTMTQTSAVIGTAQYLSPEQARGESVDARSDVYAAGCVLFELVVGHPPFVGDSPVSVAYQHVREDPKPPSTLVPSIPPEIDAMALKALAKNPLNRYQSAQEMRADALRAVSGRPVLATPVMSQAETMALNAGPQQQWSPQGATTVQRQMPGGYAGGVAPRPESRSSWVMAAVAGLAVLVVVVLGVALATSNANKDKTGQNDAQVPVTVQMPDLAGKSDKEARAELEVWKFTNYTATDPKTGDDCDDKVVAQSPEPGTEMQPNDKITYTICTKPEEKQVPGNLVGNNLDFVKSTLESLGFEVNTREVNSIQPKNQVIEVEGEGQTLPFGTTLTVKYSNNSLVEVPKVTDGDQSAAEALLGQAGLETKVVLVQVDGDPGTVIEQSVAPGERVKRGSEVIIQVIDVQPEPEPSVSETSDPGDGGGEGEIP